MYIVMKENVFRVIIACVIAFTLLNCGGQKKADPNHIKVGVASGPEFKVAQAAQRVAREKYNLNVELISFNDYVVPNEALNQGDIDVNAFQHKPYLDEQSMQRGYKLAVVGNTFIYPIAGYSRKIKTLNELQPESTILIPNDPTNGGRSLLLLEKNGLLKLREGVGLLPRVIDIVENPKHLRILELEAPQLPRALDDANVTIAIINSTFSSAAGLVPSRDALFIEDKDSPYVNLIVAREDNKDAENVKKFVKAFQSTEVEEAAAREFKGGAVKGW
jgi:D-methionine transport system substrate-binding protein